MWAGTSTGRIFVSRNADAEPASAVTYTRIDSLRTPALPNRFPSGIAVDPADPNHAWISYSGYNSTVGSVTPGRVFEVTFDPVAKTATWVDRSTDLGDLPLTDIALTTRPAMYVSNDFGVPTGEGHDVVVRRRRWTPGGRGPRAHDRPGRTPAVCGDPRDECLVHEPAVAGPAGRSDGAAREGRPRHNVRTLFGFRFTGSSGGHPRTMALRTLAVAAAALAVAVWPPRRPTVTAVSKSPLSAGCLVQAGSSSP